MTENPLGCEKISKLLKDFALPSIMATLVGSLYNIVDQFFIGQGEQFNPGRRKPQVFYDLYAFGRHCKYHS